MPSNEIQRQRIYSAELVSEVHPSVYQRPMTTATARRFYGAQLAPKASFFLRKLPRIGSTRCTLGKATSDFTARLRSRFFFVCCFEGLAITMDQRGRRQYSPLLAHVGRDAARYPDASFAASRLHMCDGKCTRIRCFLIYLTGTSRR